MQCQSRAGREAKAPPDKSFRTNLSAARLARKQRFLIVEKCQCCKACCPSAGEWSRVLPTFFESTREKPEQPAALWPAGREHALEFGSDSEQTDALHSGSRASLWSANPYLHKQHRGEIMGDKCRSFALEVLDGRSSGLVLVQPMWMSNL